MENDSVVSFADLVGGHAENETLLASDDFWERMKESSQKSNNKSNEPELVAITLLL